MLKSLLAVVAVIVMPFAVLGADDPISRFEPGVETLTLGAKAGKPATAAFADVRSSAHGLVVVENAAGAPAYVTCQEGVTTQDKKKGVTLAPGEKHLMGKQTGICTAITQGEASTVTVTAGSFKVNPLPSSMR